MSELNEELDELSVAARSALADMRSLRIGESLPLGTAGPARAELARFGFVGAGDGLTMRGSLAAEVMKRRLEGELL